MVLSARLDDLGLAERTNLFVVSDHGVTRYGRAIDVDRMLIEASVKAGLGSDDVVVAANGPCAHLYVNGHDREGIEAIVALLQRQEWSGVLFTSSTLRPEGNGPVAATRQRAERSPSPLGWADGTFSL